MGPTGSFPVQDFPFSNFSKVTVHMHSTDQSLHTVLFISDTYIRTYVDTYKTSDINTLLVYSYISMPIYEKQAERQGKMTYIHK